jgi:lysophospholipase L1-like esterase
MLSLLALGDSYTIGEAVAECERWPNQLTALLTPLALSVHIIAKTGWTTDELCAALDAAQQQLTPPYDFVSLLIGVNNQYRGLALAEYGAQFDALLHRAIQLAGGRAERVVVLSIPDWGNTPFGAKDARGVRRIAKEINHFNAAHRKVCARNRVHTINITPLSRRRSPVWIASDGLHPSALAYREWAKLVAAWIQTSDVVTGQM